MNMLTNLPDTMKQQMIRYLEEDNFVAAKQIYDAYMVRVHQEASGLDKDDYFTTHFTDDETMQ